MILTLVVRFCGERLVKSFSMAPKGSQTTIELRELIVRHSRSGKTVREISSIVNRAPTTVFNIIKRYKNTTEYKNKAKPSGRKIFTDADERWIAQQIKKNPHLSAPKLTAEVEKYLGEKVNPETVRIVLRKHQYNGRVARRKPFISKVNRAKRLKFAKKYGDKDISFWQRVLFTDESKYNVFRSDGRSYVWRKANEELKEKNLKPSVKHGGGSVMVWGAMSAAGPGNLFIIDGIMDQMKYIDILKSNMKESAEKLGIGNDFMFYQDNDPKHKAHKVRNWLLYNCPHVLETPPQSPDLNAIEHLWSHLEEKLKKHTITNQNQLKIVLKDEWSKIEPSVCRKLVESMPSRLKAVKNQKGLPTKY